ncbi:uncharacterized protein LOC143424058 [Xylocopa sonorina]|uniref:uncharacterized protein LOC143424058 n=1 Tax=Xylocopa sonorina TaxID=1818115 RepID=UPI00403AB386
MTSEYNSSQGVPIGGKLEHTGASLQVLVLQPDKKHTRDVRSAQVEYMSRTREAFTSLVLEPLRSFVLQRVSCSSVIIFLPLVHCTPFFVFSLFSFICPVRPCNKKSP